MCGKRYGGGGLALRLGISGMVGDVWDFDTAEVPASTMDTGGMAGG
jgi:hypothetical protein